VPIKLHCTRQQHRLSFNLGHSTGGLHGLVLGNLGILVFQVPCWRMVKKFMQRRVCSISDAPQAVHDTQLDLEAPSLD
jgi:hypothetical protein